ncbi:vWA domain-containing protein [Nannocystis punicea]|uniref:VWA domain-containing protein n=1 Tax=Nannocystis punicea TaxID=2995304 RepID=A0ABY7HIP2_9BACT|nr:VWA domain-containing protein [Nannocystis poenicansa]WAS98930.1 VWA domain-containing protein [Nannocystis poenicansa]
MPIRLRPLACLAAFTLLTTAAEAAPPDKDERERRPMKVQAYDFAADALVEGMMAPSPSMGATPGGAQDIQYFRDRVKAGEVPHPNTFTPEGLFSEHDLPLAAGRTCDQLLCTVGEATGATLLAQPDVQYLAQLGFSSGLDPKTFKRAPLNLVAIIDKSGSMSGQPLDLVRESLLRVLDQLGPDDQLSLVLYGDRAHVHLSPTPARDKRAIAAHISTIESAGSTAMEEGLQVGYDLARRSGTAFKGTTRVMLFTDERPNVGATDKQSFMGMARDASRSGIGLTTVGVGVQFGAELATAISSVRGGNLFFFPDAARMTKVFREDFDTMVTELAYDLKLEVKPAAGLKIAGVYGIPGKAIEWAPGGAIRLSVETIFLSRKKGAIYVGFGPADRNLPGPKQVADRPLGHVSLAYTEVAVGKPRSSAVDLVYKPGSNASVGLVRGARLVDQATTLSRAAALHHEQNDQEGAYQLVHALASLYRQDRDPELAEERTLVFALERTFAKLSGHAGEPAPAAPSVDRVSGLPPAPRRAPVMPSAPSKILDRIDHP